VLVGGLDVRELRADLFDGASPEVAGVPTRSAPPLPMYGPSVPSRTTTKSMPSGATRARSRGLPTPG
jgi:hypothetical protein